MFDSNGHLLKFNGETQIWADPADINVLPEYSSDPRTVVSFCGACMSISLPYYDGRRIILSMVSTIHATIYTLGWLHSTQVRHQLNAIYKR